jgi:hypothetical protein
VDRDSRSAIIRANERIKYLSSFGLNAGSALLIAALGTWFVKGLNGFDAYILIGLVISGLSLWSGFHILTMLEAEE